MARIDEILKQMMERDASDLHLTSGSAPYLRVHGEMVRLNYKDLTPEVCQALLFEILSSSQRENFLETWDLDCSYSLKGVGRFRVNVFRQRQGVGAVFRRIPEFEESGYEVARQWRGARFIRGACRHSREVPGQEGV